MIEPPPYDLREDVMRRDRCCFGYRLVQMHVLYSHQCKDQWGYPHLAHNTDKLQLAHVWVEFSQGVYAKKAPTDKYHLLAECAALNVPSGGETGPTELVREWERKYLRNLYPDAYPLPAE
jgi:hypothetical protein